MARIDDMMARLPSWWDTSLGSITYDWMLTVANELDAFDVEKNKLKLSLFIDTAVGQELDDIGQLFKLNRITGESDDSYRIRLKSARTSLTGSGTKQGLINAFTGATGLDNSNITITELAPMKVKASMFFTQGTTFLIPTALNIMNKSKAAGVYLINEVNFLLEDEVSVSDLIEIIPGSIAFAQFIADISVADGIEVLS